jgi:hypothetical protein
MLHMIDEKLARFESNLERLVENTFTSFFGRRMRAHDLALEIARALQESAHAGTHDDPRPVAPDVYEIQLSQPLHAQILPQQEELIQTLTQHIVDLALHAGYRLKHNPTLRFVIRDSGDRHAVRVAASHSNLPRSSTTSMKRVEIPRGRGSEPLRAYLLINSERAIFLDEVLTSIGRQRDNHIILDDPYVSRHHLQIRRRENEFILFDIRSQGNTFVNGVQVKEHHLQTGDVIQLGKSTLVFVVDNPSDDEPLNQTQPLD